MLQDNVMHKEKLFLLKFLKNGWILKNNGTIKWVLCTDKIGDHSIELNNHMNDLIEDLVRTGELTKL